LWSQQLAPTRNCMSQSEIYTVFCIVVDIGRAFPVDIEKDKTIGQSKELIIEKDPKTFADVQSYLFDLYHVDIADDKDMMANAKAYPLDSPLPATRRLDRTFPNTPERHKVHFIVKLGKFHQ